MLSITRDSKLRCPYLVLAMLICSSASAQTSRHSAWRNFVTLGLASETVHHGVSLSDDQLTPDAKLVVQHQSGLFTSLAATRVNLAGLVSSERTRQWQLAYDLGYNLSLHHHWNLSANHTWYQYTSNSATTRDYDYNTWTASLHYRDYLSLLYSTTDKLWGFDVQKDSLSIVGRYPFTEKLLSELEIGTITNKRYVETEYSFARINVGYVHGQWSTQLQYHYSDSHAEQLYQKDRVGSQLVAKFSYHFSIR